ncbi:MAG TPA: hypothetical protein PKC59_14465 [Burkholderiaceae bacterium]|nr:hypothetical protein [Burkholderiaceae bacterium]HMX10941.1 hypothetical protein [Burkholderiaceae bacterium]HMZ02423.1 hypothetical protein [Burkholderiaceae bacterium]HNB44794.1 hypothetical protein [Burkholderiaceae bacterium]HNG77842.1 hypothetical protein [Burkholderiaceae bacterium]
MTASKVSSSATFDGAQELSMARVLAPTHRAHRIPQRTEPPDLLALTDLKWVMSAYVDRIDTDRLLREPAYARRCLDAACATPSELVRSLATRVLSPLI